jgi:hypothetical protein
VIEGSYTIADRDGHPLVTVIELWEKWTKCHRCNADTISKWGLPVREDTAEYCEPDYAGEWGGVPACKPCFDWYEAKYPKATQ